MPAMFYHFLSTKGGHRKRKFILNASHPVQDFEKMLVSMPVNLTHCILVFQKGYSVHTCVSSGHFLWFKNLIFNIFGVFRKVNIFWE